MDASEKKRRRLDDTEARKVKALKLLEYTDDTHSRMVTMYVGPEEHEFKFFLSLLLPKSGTFKHLSETDKWHEDPEPRVRMPEFRTKYFAMYWHWVHTSRLDYKALDCSTRLEPAEPRFVGLGHGKERLLRTNSFDADNLHRVRNESARRLATHLIKLWMLANLLGDPGCQDAISKELARWFLDRKIPADIPVDHCSSGRRGYHCAGLSASPVLH